MRTTSELPLVNTTFIPDAETEKKTSWLVRTLARSVNGRIAMSSYETMRATGTSIKYLSPWGDSNPVVLPCIRVRDLVAHTVLSATGGAGAILGPVMDSIGQDLLCDFGHTVAETIVVELTSFAGAKLTEEAGNQLFVIEPVALAARSNNHRLVTTATKSLTITLKYKHVNAQAELLFYKSAHGDSSWFSNVKDYFSIEKGWFSPYLYASERRPDIPRTITPDVVFCRGPFLNGDYEIGKTLLDESTIKILLCKLTSPSPPTPVTMEGASRSHLHLPSSSDVTANPTSRARFTSPSTSNLHFMQPSSTTLYPSTPPAPFSPRRMVILVLGIKPHRCLWSTCARPGESVIKYILLNGCPAIVVPVRQGSPLIAWDAQTLTQLHKIGRLPGGVESAEANEVINVLFRYLDLWVDWERVIVPGEQIGGEKKEAKELAVKNAVGLLVAGAINSGTSKEAQKAVDSDRAGIVMFRIP